MHYHLWSLNIMHVSLKFQGEVSNSNLCHYPIASKDQPAEMLQQIMAKNPVERSTFISSELALSVLLDD